jgi:hypothetical protein
MRYKLVMALFLALDATAAAAQSDDRWDSSDRWDRFVAEADSIGPVAPFARAARSVRCGPGVQVADSVELSGALTEFIFARYSTRTRGMFDHMYNWFGRGSVRLALLAVECEPDNGRPYVLVLERDHRYFYAVFSLRERPTYSTVRFRSATGEWQLYLWDPQRRTFAPNVS